MPYMLKNNQISRRFSRKPSWDEEIVGFVWIEKES